MYGRIIGRRVLLDSTALLRLDRDLAFGLDLVDRAVRSSLAPFPLD